MSASGPIDRETWARINDLFHRALEQPPGDRRAFLDRASGGDERVRAEVESLLASHDQAGDFIERPAGDVASLIGERPAAPAMMPAHIGSYRLIRVLGEGGMGVVYLAEDERLGRTVALKALAPRFVGDTTRRERLRREARAAASLNHPGIATVYALEEVDDHLYIAGEYVPGETLRDELARGPLTPLRAIDTTLDLARALTVAHQHGIVHRDLKPENVIRMPGDGVKILDFGLARVRDYSPADLLLSADGAVLGTPAYMSPEQIRGISVDQRSDLFTLGVMLYELVTGRHPFRGTDSASTIAKILEAEPARLTDQLPGDAPPASLGALERVVLTCLRKFPEQRFENAGDFIAALSAARDALTSPSSGLAAAAVPMGSQTQSELALWWWRFHQAATVAVYGLLLIPLWFARGSVPPPYGTLLFLMGLIGVVVASALRLHLWFADRIDPAGWRAHHTRAGRWRRVGDMLFAAALVAVGGAAIAGIGAGGTADQDPSWLGVMLVAASAAVIISFAIIEPTTTQAAFGSTDQESRV